MEGVSVSAYKRLKGYWRRRSRARGGYEKLTRSKSAPTRRKRVWRIRFKIRVAPKIKLGFLRRAARSPRRLLVWLRDAYVRLMLGFASSRVCSAGYGFGADGAAAFGRNSKEYDNKMIVEIYRSILLAQGNHSLHRQTPDNNNNTLVLDSSRP